MSTITLPSGLVGEVRGLTGKDGRYLTNEQLVRDNEVEDYIFGHCWASTVDEGPYNFQGSAPDWGRVLVGDRFYLLISVREETYPGKEYVVPLQCQQGGCKKRFEWEIDLRKLLKEKTRRLSTDAAAIFKAGNRFEALIPFTTTPFVFQLSTGAHAKRTQARIEAKKTGPKNMQARQNKLVDALAGQILEINGATMKADALFDFLEDLPLPSLDALLPLMQSRDCGVETDVEADCPFCGGGMLFTLPFGRAFFLPHSAAAKQDRKRALPVEPEAEDAKASAS